MSHEILHEETTLEEKSLSALSKRALAFSESFPWNHVYYGKKLRSPLSPPKKLLLLALLKVNEHLPPAKKGSRKARNADAAYNKSCRLTVAEMTECINEFLPDNPIEHHTIHSFVSSESIKLVQNYSQRLNIAIQAEYGRFKYGKVDKREDFERLFTEAVALAEEAYKIHKARIIVPKNLATEEEKKEKNRATQKRLQTDRRSTHNNEVDARAKRIVVPFARPAFVMARHLVDVEKYIAGDEGYTLPECISITEGSFYSKYLCSMVPGVRIDITKKLLKTKATREKGDISWTLTNQLKSELPNEDTIFIDEMKHSSIFTTLFGRYSINGKLVVDVAIVEPTWTGTGTRVVTNTYRKLLMVRETALARRESAVPV